MLAEQLQVRHLLQPCAVILHSTFVGGATGGSILVVEAYTQPQSHLTRTQSINQAPGAAASLVSHAHGHLSQDHSPQNLCETTSMFPHAGGEAAASNEDLASHEARGRLSSHLSPQRVLMRSVSADADVDSSKVICCLVSTVIVEVDVLLELFALTRR